MYVAVASWSIQIFWPSFWHYVCCLTLRDFYVIFFSLIYANGIKLYITITQHFKLYITLINSRLFLIFSQLNFPNNSELNINFFADLIIKHINLEKILVNQIVKLGTNIVKYIFYEYLGIKITFLLNIDDILCLRLLNIWRKWCLSLKYYEKSMFRY